MPSRSTPTFCEPDVQYHGHKRWPQYPILNQLYPVHTLRYIYVLFSRPRTDLPTVPPPSFLEHTAHLTNDNIKNELQPVTSVTPACLSAHIWRNNCNTRRTYIFQLCALILSTFWNMWKILFSWQFSLKKCQCDGYTSAIFRYLTRKRCLSPSKQTTHSRPGYC
jgi:hypothetical protein